MSKPALTGGALRAKPWPLLNEALDAGIAFGWNRAFKYLDIPEETLAFLGQNEATIKEALANEILNEICERFSIEDPCERA